MTNHEEHEAHEERLTTRGKQRTRENCLVHGRSCFVHSSELSVSFVLPSGLSLRVEDFVFFVVDNITLDHEEREGREERLKTRIKAPWVF